MYLKDTIESLTRVGPRTPMGDLLRRFWLPALPEHDVPKHGEEPVDLRLLGEDLVCDYDAGRILITDRYFKEMAPYPAVAQGGVVWTYMGPHDFTPQLPVFAWFALPPIKRATSNRIEACTWAYAVEASLAADTQPIFMPPFYTSADVDHVHAYVPIDDTHTLAWSFGPNTHLDAEPSTLAGDNERILNFRHQMIELARETARGHAPEQASHGEWYAMRPFPG
jgi:hypothetical protein